MYTKAWLASISIVRQTAYKGTASEARNLTQGIPEPESYRTHDEHRAKMRKLTFNDLVDQNRVLIGDPAEVREKVAHVAERLYLTDLSGNFALGSLPDAPTRATLRRFVEQVAPKFRGRCPLTDFRLLT
ncbi:MAG: hypothetical protein WD688_10240 [Candidatus Binatia bacterium]